MEILFKALYSETLQWVEGNIYTNGSQWLMSSESGDNDWVIIKESICQYTNKLDKHNEKIFVGDLIKWEGYIVEVFFCTEKLQFMAKNKAMTIELWRLDSSGISIISNIHDK